MSETDRCRGCHGVACLTRSTTAAPKHVLRRRQENGIRDGEDIGRRGGVYGVTKPLQSRFGAQRVIDTLLDEQSILCLAIGLGYQKSFGGHFHNDNSLAVLRAFPGLIVGCPSNGSDAVRMYREAILLAREDQRVVVMVEPIALYPMRDLLVDGNGAWMGLYPDADERAGLGAGRDLAIVTYGNGVYLSEQVRLDLAAEGYEIRVIDLRWLAPLPLTRFWMRRGIPKRS